MKVVLLPGMDGGAALADAVQSRAGSGRGPGVALSLLARGVEDPAHHRCVVKEGFGIAGKDLGIGADIMIEAALGQRFPDAGGRYFHNDAGRFAPANPTATDAAHIAAVMEVVGQLAGA